MQEYWETKFKNEGLLWGFYPSESAISTVDIFETNKLRKILIPGFGYGRNAKLFLDQGFDVTGIEISQSAIGLARKSSINCKIFHGSVTSMPFDNAVYDGIFCYALIHVLNRIERKSFLKTCFNQLKVGGMMFFVVASTKTNMFGKGEYLSKNRFRISKGLNVFFYDDLAIKKEFDEFGLYEYTEVEEPIKFMKDEPPIKLILIKCKK
jgi:ubiquinone/menaquinone biosynthesis C-methylase UbiE